MHRIIERDHVVADPDREWAVYRCDHGCFHLSLGRLTVTLTADEFHLLRELLQRICQRLAEPRLDSDAPAVLAH
jgi:hypothetical protein